MSSISPYIGTLTSSGSLTTTSSGSLTTTGTNIPWIISSGPSTTSTSTSYNTYDTYVNPLKKLIYSVDFCLDDDRKHFLEDHICEIKKNKFFFNCFYDGNRIQPYEYIMELIKEKQEITVKIYVSDILTICYTNLQFTKIENNLHFNSYCDFSVLKVKFKYEKILYENHKLLQKELRVDKLKKINKSNDCYNT